MTKAEKAVAEFQAERDVLQEVLDSVPLSNGIKVAINPPAQQKRFSG